MAVLPYNKYFRLVKGGTFSYNWQYLLGIPSQATPFDLTGHTGTWTIHAPTGVVTYSTGASPGHSGVFFGTNGNLTTGVITLVISSTDTAGFTWVTAPYTFAISDSSMPSVVTSLLTGSVNAVLSLP